ncbi:MAG: TMEM14 family protein [Cyanobacteria bacterium SID2]|nr:TMEM14 family protein [Cyanobacteria bacterium SID2]MBP0003909.1 TMEM14 family protein [Cyanobacteria bacterium SBC]
MTLAVVTAIGYGLLIFVGGIAGYVKAGSRVSLISGIASGTLLILGGVLQFQGLTWGLWLSMAVAGLLVVTFAVRYLKTRKLMPALPAIGLGAISIAIFLQQLIV